MKSIHQENTRIETNTTDESPTCEMNSISLPTNIRVAVEPDSSSSPFLSSLYKMKHHLNLPRNNIEYPIIFATISNTHLMQMPK